MSAYIVDTDTIAYLTEAARRWGVRAYASVPPASVDALTLALSPAPVDGRNAFGLYAVTGYHTVAAVLYAANVASVNARYTEASTAELPQQALSVLIPQIDPMTALASIACLRYQSCERTDYPATFGAHLLDTIEREAIRHLPGYDDAPWGWTRSQRSEPSAPSLEVH